MKLLAVVSTIDMKYRMGTTPAWWQLLKAMHELGHEIILTPYLGAPIETPWWRCYLNPCQSESQLYNWYLNKSGKRSIGKSGVLSTLSRTAINQMITPRWKKHLLNICQEEKPDAVLFMIVPLNHIIGIPMAIRKQFHIPALYFDGDLPTSLPSYAHLNSFKFNMYTDANLLEYDIFLSCSNGIKEKLEDMRVRKVEVLYYAADPSVFRPVPVAKQPIDIFYYGHRAKGKEQQMDYMIKESSLAMPETTFMVAGQEYDPNMGKAITCGHMPLNTWQRWCSMSKINLNITKDIDRNIYGSSSARPFELAAMGCCIVSDEYKGMQEWFKEYSEIAIVKNKEEAIEIYKLLLGNERLRSAMGEAARKRVLAEHTYLHRAKQLTKIIKRI